MAARSDVRQLLLQVDANVELARRALDGLDRDIGRDTASMDRSLGRIDQAFGRLTAAAAAFVSIRGLSSLGQQFLGIADQSKQMQAQLQLATAQLGSFGQAQKDVESIADATRAGLGETANLYGNFIRAAADSGRTQSDAARATQSFAQALKIGGASADEARSATLQFGQALASGVLRGDEFNSIMEASPRIARLLADSLGVPIGQLRELAEEGKLTREVLFNALLDGNLTKGLQGEFDRLPITFADAMTQVENAAITTFGAFDRGGQFSTAIANFVSDGASDFKTLAGEAEDLGRDIRGTIAGLANVWDGFEDAGVAAMRTIKQEYGPLLRVVEGYIERAKFANKIAGYLNLPGAVAGVILNNPLIKDRFTAGRDTYVEDSLRRSVLSDIWAEGIPTFPSESGGGNGSTGGGGGARRVSTRARKLTDADLSPMQLILRDIGKEGLPIDAGYQKELTEELTALTSIGTHAERIAQYEGAVGKLLSEADQDRLEQFSHYFSEDLAAGIANAVVYADSLGDALENTFKRAAAALLESGLLELLSPGSAGGGTWRGFIGKAGSIFSGLGFANGGSPPVGKASLVGERGPELFIPRVPGVVVPNHMLGDWGSTVQVQQSFSVNAQGAVLAADLMSEMRSIGVRAAAGGAALAQQQIGRRSRQALR
ncbi:prophage LambdaMc01, tail tape measure protein [Sphingomonas sp. MM-1]|nr:tape measure protein [Sphingomonas sp.]AGH48771.1 prophage LambdaMc01, tail tape measure protein [Sphingomonas sp. MM-1]MDX3884025.1 tape measure protein [Sphingomonas sp.]